MKFTKEEAADDLKRQLKSIVGDPAINDKAIADTVATLLPLLANDDTELSAFTTQVLPVLKTGDGNARKYASNAVKKREKELAESQAQKDASEGKDEPLTDYEALMRRVQALEEEKQENDRKAAVSAKRAEIAKAIESKGVKDREWVSDLLGEVSIAADADAEATADKYVKLYNRVHATTPPSVTPVSANAGGMEQNPFAALSARMKARREAEREAK